MNDLKAQLPREVIGYYPSWQWYDRNGLVNPQSIVYTKYSIINYAFFKPKADGSLEGTDTWADEVLLKGKINYSTEPRSYYPNTSIVDLAHQAGTKIVISIGGWTHSDLFSDIANDNLKRETFAKGCRRLVETYHLDGVDLDWEYPGVADRFGKPYDKENFTLLLRGIRGEFQDLSLKTGKNYLLTSAFGVSNNALKHIDWANVAPLLDAINLMTYDFYGAWDKKAGHNSPLFPSAGEDSNTCVDGAVQLLMNKYGVSADKINIGAAFYGHALKTKEISSLFLTGKKDAETFRDEEGSPLFYNILKKKQLFEEQWDEAAKVPFLIGKEGLNTFLSYDNERSLFLKGQYIADKKLRGAIIWELTGDYILNADSSISTPLLDSLIAGMGQPNIPQTADSVLTIATIDSVKNDVVQPSVAMVDSVVEMALIQPTSQDTLEEKVETAIAEVKPINTENNVTAQPIIASNTEGVIVAITPMQPVESNIAILENLDIQMNENDFLILKFTMKQGGNICLRLVSGDKEITRDLDLGIVGEGYNERFSTIHRHLKSGKYKIWIEACSAEMSLNPKIYKEWIKD